METQSAAYFDQRVIQEMGKHLWAPAWSVKQKLALTCQMLASEGHESGLAGQISARAEPPGSFWTLKFGLGFDEATEDTLIRVDDDLGTLEGEGIPNPATRFHLWIYRTRPDVNCRLMLGSGVLHTLERTEVLEMKRVFPRMLHKLRPSRKACKNNLLRQI